MGGAGSSLQHRLATLGIFFSVIVFLGLSSQGYSADILDGMGLGWTALCFPLFTCPQKGCFGRYFFAAARGFGICFWDGLDTLVLVFILYRRIGLIGILFWDGNTEPPPPKLPGNPAISPGEGTRRVSDGEREKRDGQERKNE